MPVVLGKLMGRFRPLVKYVYISEDGPECLLIDGKGQDILFSGNLFIILLKVIT